MSTIRRQILQKLGGLLAPLTVLPSSPKLYDNADDALEPGKLPAVVFAWTDDESVPVGMVDKHTLYVSVTAICKGPDAEDDADALLIAAHDLIQEGRHFDGFVKNLRRKGTHRDASPEGTKYVVLTQQYELDYMAQDGSLTERA
jgi:hypothetical protein